MALLFMDSFDHYAQADLLKKWDSAGQSAGTIAASGRFGSRWQDDGDDRKAIGKIIPNTEVVIMGFAFYVAVWPIYSSVVITGKNGANSLLLYLDSSTHVLQLYKGATYLGQAATALAYNAWQYIEVKYKCHQTDGGGVVKVNGVSMIKVGAYADVPVGLDTTDTANNYLTSIYLRGSNIGYDSLDRQGFCGTYYYDDVYIADDQGSVSNNFLGDTRIEYLAPTGAGVMTQFTPSTGSNWQNVDESPASDADYNSNNSPGAMDLFQMANLSGNGLVHGVQTISRSKKDDAGFRKAEPVFYKASGLGSTARLYKGSKTPVLDNFSNLPIQVFSVSPDTGVAWTVDEVNALQYGYAVGDAGMFTLDAKVV